MDHFCILFLREKDVPAPAGGAATYWAGGKSPQPSRAGYRRRTSRLCVNRNKNAGNAAVSQTELKARHPAPGGDHLPVEEVALWRNG